MVGEVIRMFERSSRRANLNEGREKKENQPTIIEIVRFVEDEPEPRILVRCEIVDGKVYLRGVTEGRSREEIGGIQNIITVLEQEGIFSPEDRKMVFPKDGQKFLKALRDNFRHPYEYARVVK